MPADDIVELIGRVGLGDRSAFRKLYDRTSPKLFGICLRILRERAEAEDALQETYVKIWHNASKFTAMDYSPITWLVAVARNTAIDRVRARKPQSVEIDDIVDAAADGPSPEQAAIAAADRRRIDGCLDELEKDRAAAVRGAYIEGFSYQELADQFSLPLNTMRTWLRRSLMRLKDCLER